MDNVRRDARALAAVGVPVFLYRFRRAPDVFGRKAGAFHGSELAYLFPSVFKNHGLVMRDDDRKLTELMTGYWSHFAATGDPNFPGAPVWPRYDSSDRHLEIDIEPRPDRTQEHRVRPLG